MKDEQKPKTQEKAPYQPPEVVRVSLRPEEAVLGHCKVTGTTGPVSGSCKFPTPCPSLGS